MPQQTPLYILASPQPRVGKTLIARLLVEFLLADHRRLAGYDLHSREPTLAGYFPDLVHTADIADTLGQMALFDRLLAQECCTTVIDLGYGCYEQFFAVMDEIAFEQEARRRSIEPVVLFITDSAQGTPQAYAALQGLLPRTLFVPVHNEATSFMFSIKDFPPTCAEYGALRIPRLSPIVRGVIDRPRFSFRKYMEKQPGGPTEVHGWVNTVFTEFRALELRLLMGKLTAALGSGAPARPRQSRPAR
jgi:hypothetical protein